MPTTYIAIVGGEGDTFVALIPDLYECIVMAPTEQDAIAGILSALHGWIAQWDKPELPKASTRKELMQSEKILELIAEGGKFFEIDYNSEPTQENSEEPQD